MSDIATHIEKSSSSLQGTKQSQQLIPNLRFKEFDGEWNKKKLGDVLTITSAARVHKDEWTEKGVPFFRSSDVVADFKGTMNTKAYIPLELYESLSNKIGRVKKDDLLVTGGGSIGIPFLIKSNDPLYFKDADLLWLKNTKEISGYFLYSFLITQSFREYLKSISHIGTIAHYTVIQARNTPCHFPTLPEQQKIAFFLSAVDEKIQQLSKKKALLEQYKKGVMQQLFSGKLRFKDDNGKDYPDWEEKRLIELSINGFSNGAFNDPKKVGSGYRIINVKDMYVNGTISIDNLERVALDEKEFSKNRVEYGDIFFTRSSLVKEGIAYSNVNLTDEECLTYDGHLIRMRPNKELCLPIYLYYKFKTADLRKQFVIRGKTATMTTIGQEDISDVKVILPALSEQQKTANYLSSIDSKIESVSNQIGQTQNFKKGLLQQMFV